MNEHLLPPFRDVFIIADARIDCNAKILETEGAFSVCRKVVILPKVVRTEQSRSIPDEAALFHVHTDIISGAQPVLPEELCFEQREVGDAEHAARTAANFFFP